MYKLFARAGWGSALVEAQLAWYGLPFAIEDVDDLFKSAAARENLSKVNPLAQLPTLILPDGSVMTESAAITLLLSEEQGAGEALAPPAGDPTRAAFLRWLIFLVANLYPTFTYADEPSRFVPGEEAQKGFRQNVDTYAQQLWRRVDEAASRPWFLGDRFCALDIYVATMTRWRPGRAWFAEHCEKLHAIGVGAEAQPKLKAVWRRNFPEG
jgi:GST-like protein